MHMVFFSQAAFNRATNFIYFSNLDNFLFMVIYLASIFLIYFF